MMQSSPSLMDRRQTPVTGSVPESSLNAEISRLPTSILTSIRQELGLANKELHLLTFDEKSRIVNLARQRGGMPMGALQIPGNMMSPGMGGPRAPNMNGYHHGLHAVTEALAMVNLSENGASTPSPGDSPSTPSPGQSPFLGPQNNRLEPNEHMRMMLPPSLGGVTAPLPSAVVNGTPRINSATQPTTSLPEVSPNFLTTEFLQSVGRTLDDFDTQALFRPEDTGINFEQDFREWFDPDDLDIR